MFMVRSTNQRNRRGQAIVVLMAFLTVFFALALGMTAFEMARYSLCVQEFQHCVDAASLGGAAGLASSNNTNQAQAQNIAITTAQWIFERNSVLGVPLQGNSTYSISSNKPATPALNKAVLHFTWVDPTNGVPTQNPSAQKILNIQGAFGYQPLVGSWLGLPSAPFHAAAFGNGGGPILDLVLCLDLSASIDDSTITSFVERYRLQGQRNQYRQVTVNGTGTLYDVTGATNSTGTAVNACYPQQLNTVTNSGYGNLRFDPQKRGTTQGQPGTNGQSTDMRYFTDVVVNIDENPVFAGASYNGFDFPTLGSLVEAARGNLESNGAANSANVDLSAIGVSNPRPGYYQAYWQAALEHRHPLYDAQLASSTFFQMMNNSVDVHFGFIGFSSDENQTYNEEAVFNNNATHNFPQGPPSGAIPTSASVQCPIPYVALDPNPGPTYSNYSQVMQYFPPNNPPASPQITAYGGTDINGALVLAMQNLLQAGSGTGKISGGLNRAREGSTKAIVLFTDGLPTSNTGSPYNQSGSQIATKAGQEGIKIYCIGLAQINELVPPMTSTLSTIANNSGGKFYVIPPGANQSAQLNRAFQDIARSLVALVR